MSYLMTAGMGYMLDHRFQEVMLSNDTGDYTSIVREYHTKNKTDVQYEDITAKQAAHDNQAFFGALLSVCRSQVAKSITNKYVGTRDGQ